MTNLIRFPQERCSYRAKPGAGPAQIINLATWRVVHNWIKRMKERQARRG